MKHLLRGYRFWLVTGAVLLAAVVFVALVPFLRGRGPLLLCDVSAQSGIAFRHTDGSTGKRYIVETISAGLALFDYDNDGYIDVYFVNGAPLTGTSGSTPAANRLYRNEGGFKFADVTEKAAVGDVGFGLGAAVGDYDNDGDADLYVTNYGPNVLYRNNGDGTFTQVTEEAGVGGGDRVSTGVCFFDMDNDGDLDLYTAHYVEFSRDEPVQKTLDGFPVYPSPLDFAPLSDTLYRNNGDGTFTDVSAESGVGAHAAAGMAVICADHDSDGDTDVFVVNNQLGNFFFDNDGTGKFEEVGVLKGLAYDVDGRELGSRGADCADYDNDGWLDFFTTSDAAELPTLYRNWGDGSFQDVTLATGAGAGSFPHSTWGTGLVDFDNDGYRDLFIACGHSQDNIHLFGRVSEYHARNILLRNTGTGTFVNVSDVCGDGLSAKLSSRGAAFDDLDNDGDIDVVILNSRREPTILRNDSATGNHWIQIRLQGVKTNRDGVGARVKVVAGDLTQIAEVHSGRGYQSHYGTRLHFGLGKRDRVDRIEVHWIGGGVDVKEDVGVDQLLTIAEGTGTQEAQPPPSTIAEPRGPAEYEPEQEAVDE